MQSPTGLIYGNARAINIAEIDPVRECGWRFGRAGWDPEPVYKKIRMGERRRRWKRQIRGQCTSLVFHGRWNLPMQKYRIFIHGA